MNKAQELFGDERLLAAVSAVGHSRNSADAIRDRVLAAVEAFTGEPVEGDDRTLVVLQYEPVERAMPRAA